MRVDRPAPVCKPLPLVPLVDVVFLLLMFFMLSSTFTRFGDLDMLRNPSAQAQRQAEAAGPAAPPGVIVAVAQGRKFKINGVETAVEDIAASLDRYYDKGVRSGVIMLSSSAEVQDMVSVLEQAQRSKLTLLTVAR
jgi:biopolymer transport protein ExbD